MSDTLTAHYNFVKPEIAGSPDTWGNKWNANLDTFDSMFLSINTSLGSLMPTAGGTFSGIVRSSIADSGGNQLITHDQAVAIVTSYLPVGVICVWAGPIVSIPPNWRLCDGGAGTVDLRDRFVVGAGSSYGAGAVGGATSATPTITVSGHTLTVAEMPSHGHGTTENPHGHNTTELPHSHAYDLLVLAGPGGSAAVPANAGSGTGTFNTRGAITGLGIVANTTGLTVNANGGGQSHNHPASSSAVPTLPPYYALAYIVRV